MKKNLLFIYSLIIIFSCNIFANCVDFTAVVEKTHKAVVNISTVQKVKTGRTEFYNQFGRSELFDMFKNFFDFPEAEKDVVSLGSGFMIDSNGTVVTNYHVIKNAVEIDIKFHDNKKMKAKVIGRDIKTDLVILKIESDEKNFDFLVFGNSDEMSVGSPVLAIGNSFGLGNSITAGIISARARNINRGLYDDFLQTDAAMNIGNSGGPLLNGKGEVIGVNTAIASTSGNNAGVGFAIPSNLVKRITEKLIADGMIERGYMGIKVQNITKEISESLDNNEGVIVVEINKDGPAEKSGMKIGDLITAFNENPIDCINSLYKNVAYHDIDKIAQVTVWRNGKEINLNILLDKQYDDDIPNEENNLQSCPDSGLELIKGICFKDINKVSSNIKEKFQISIKNGVIAYHILDNSLSEKYNIRSGDIIEEIMYEKIQNVSEIKKIIDKLKKKNKHSLIMLINRQGNSFFTGVPIF